MAEIVSQSSRFNRVGVDLRKARVAQLSALELLW
jgi:hypothetical protein